MVRSSARRKRVKQESDEDETATTSTTVGGSKGLETSSNAAKRRKVEPETSPMPSAPSSSAPFVATTATSRRSSRLPSTSVRPSTRGATRSAKTEEVEEEEVKPGVNNVKAENPSVIFGDSRQPGDIRDTLSPLSDLSADASLVKMETADGSDKENTEEKRVKSIKREDTSPARPLSAKDKGKGRAISRDVDQAAANEAANLQAELNRLRAELQQAHSTIDHHKTLLNKVSETFTCNICLEALRHPLALTCGHVFCQDDLWNWFHRQPDEDDESSDSSDMYDSDSDGFSDHSTGGLTARRSWNPEAFVDQRNRDGSENSDLISVEDDYNTDDSLSDSHSGEESDTPPPVTVRGGIRIQTTRGENVARARVARSAAPTGLVAREDVSGNAVAAEPMATAPVPPAPAPTVPAEDTAATPGASRRVPPLQRPRRRNLVCPQCRSRISLPPFPIFVLRGVSDLLSAHAGERRSQSVEAEREGDNIVDTTWGGLFPRAAGGIGRHAARHVSASVNSAYSSPRAVLNPAALSNPREQPVPSQNRSSAPAEAQSDAESEGGRSETSTNSIALLQREVTRADATGEVLPAESRARALLYDLFPENDLVAPVAGPSRPRNIFNGRHSRDEAEHDTLLARGRNRQLEEMIRHRDARRRAHRASRNARGPPLSGEEERELRDIEDRAIDVMRRRLLLQRAQQPRNNASTARGRDILRHGIRDSEDGVRRCIDCNWEIANNKCEHCGTRYDTDSEFEDHGASLEEEATSPPPATNEQSELSFVDRDEPSQLGLDSYADPEQEEDASNEEGDEDESLMRDSGDETEESEDNDEAGSATTANVPRRTSTTRRKRNPYMYDSADEEAEDENEENEDNFFVHDATVERMDTSEADQLLDDEEEAEETDRETRRARKEERRQARAARRISTNTADSASDAFTSESEDEESESESEEEPRQTTSRTSPSGSEGQADDDDDLPTISSQQVRQEMQQEMKKGKSRSTAAQNAARAAISRTQKVPEPAVNRSDPDPKQTNGPHAGPFRRKRVIEESDEE